MIIIVYPFILYQITMNEIYVSLNSTYEFIYISIYDYKSINDLPVYKKLKNMQSKNKKCDRICRLAKYLYRKEMKRLNDWWYIWDQLMKTKKEKLRGKGSNKRTR